MEEGERSGKRKEEAWAERKLRGGGERGDEMEDRGLKEARNRARRRDGRAKRRWPGGVELFAEHIMHSEG